jgi:hypothetical protein
MVYFGSGFGAIEQNIVNDKRKIELCVVVRFSFFHKFCKDFALQAKLDGTCTKIKSKLML